MPGPKVLAQTAGTGAQVSGYTVPSGGGTVISTIALVNDTDGPLSARVRVAPAGAADAAVHTIVPTTWIPARDLVPVTIGLTLAPTDVVRVLADTGVNVHLYGTEL